MALEVSEPAQGLRRKAQGFNYFYHMPCAMRLKPSAIYRKIWNKVAEV
jgi:hypothetical protein